MKILHCSDLHLGKRPSGTKKFVETRFEDYFIAFEKLLNKVLNLELDIMIISGDLFDKKEINANILERTENLFKFIKNAKKDLRILVIEGNHDVINNSEDSWLEYLKNKNYIEVFSYRKNYEEENFLRIEDINFYPVGYPGFMIDKSLTALAEKLDASKKNIVIVHTAIFGIENLPGLVSKETIDLFKDKVIYMAGGHIHSFSTYPNNNPYFFIPGSLEYTNIPREKADKKGAIYFDTETRTYDFIEIKPRKRIKTEVFYYENNIEEEFDKFLKSLSLDGGEILIVPISIKNNEYLKIEDLESIAEKNGALKLYVEIRGTFINSDNLSEDSHTSIEEIEKNIINSWEILNKKEKFFRNFTKLKEYTENSDAENFFNLFDELLIGDDTCDN